MDANWFNYMMTGADEIRRPAVILSAQVKP